MKSIKHVAWLAVSAGLFLASCSKQIDHPYAPQSTSTTPRTVTGPYANGFFLINEGWYGHGTGEVNFYNYSTSSLQDSVFGIANPTKNLNPATSTLQHGAIFNGKLYLVSKVGGPLVVCDEGTLVESARIAASSSNDWRAFVGVTSSSALVSSNTGIYPLTLPALTVGTKLSGASISGQVGDMIKSGNYIFALSSASGLVIINATTKAVVSTIAGINVGFAKTSDGSVWCAGGTLLYKIDSSTLTSTTVTLPFTANSAWAAWHPGSIKASTAQNAIFIVNNGTNGLGGTTIYKYVVGTPSSLSAPFITVPAGTETYGSGIGYDASVDRLVVTTVESGFTTHYSVNDLRFYNASTGAFVSHVAYSGYWFPSLTVFH